MAALDGTGFYARAAIAWLLSACLAAAILRGWIRGQGFRARTVHLATLFYSTWLSRDALKLHLAHGVLPEVPPISVAGVRSCSYVRNQFRRHY
jgi:hypothetical protein